MRVYTDLNTHLLNQLYSHFLLLNVICVVSSSSRKSHRQRSLNKRVFTQNKTLNVLYDNMNGDEYYMIKEGLHNKKNSPSHFQLSISTEPS